MLGKTLRPYSRKLRRVRAVALRAALSLPGATGMKLVQKMAGLRDEDRECKVREGK